MKLSELFRPILSESVIEFRDDARGFGRWLTRLLEDITGDRDSKGIFNYDYLDDNKGMALRYRLMVSVKYLKLIQGLERDINGKGWYITVVSKLSPKHIQMVFEPEITSRVKKDVMWHVTDARSAEQITQEGLVAKASRHGLKYPQPRVYMFRDRKDAERMADSLSRRDKENIDYVLLRVDLRKAPGITLHIDPELSKVATFTTQPIPARAITIAGPVSSAR